MHAFWRDIIRVNMPPQEVRQIHAEIKARHTVYPHIDIVALDPQELITHPAAREAQHDRLLVCARRARDCVYLCTDIDEETAYGFLLRRERDVGGGHFAAFGGEVVGGGGGAGVRDGGEGHGVGLVADVEGETAEESHVGFGVCFFT